MSKEDQKPDNQDDESAKLEGQETPPVDDNDDDDEILGDPGKRALKSERKLRQAAESKLGTLESQLAEMTKKLQKIEDDEAAEQGKWEKLANDRATRIEELENEIAKNELETKKAQAISKYKFTDEELTLLHGESLEDYEANAKALAKLLKKNSGPDVSGGTNAQGHKADDEPSSRLKTWKFK